MAPLLYISHLFLIREMLDFHYRRFFSPPVNGYEFEKLYVH